MTIPTFNIEPKSIHNTAIKFKTQVNKREYGGEQRYCKNIYPIREFILRFDKNSAGRQELENFFASVYGSFGSFYWTWPLSMGGNGATYTCWLDNDVLEQNILRLGYTQAELKFVARDLESYSPPASLSQYHKAELTKKSKFHNIVDSIITSQFGNNRRKIWNTPLKNWEVEYEINEVTRKELESFFIAKKGKFHFFLWEWQTEKGGDGNTYNVRFDTDNLGIDVLKQGYGKIKLPLQEVLPNTPTQTHYKDEIIPRKLLEINIDGSPIRILDNDTLDDITYGGHSYVGAPLELGNDKQTESTQVTKLKAKISNANEVISSIIGSDGDIITGCDCTLRLVWLDTSDYSILAEPASSIVLKGKADDLSFTNRDAEINIVTNLNYDKKIPFMTHGATCQYRRFKDNRCKYTGDATTCDRTLQNCIALGNEENFGGYPNMPKELVIES